MPVFLQKILKKNVYHLLWFSQICHDPATGFFLLQEVEGDQMKGEFFYNYSI